jgi:hypothetical protein
MLNHKNGEVLEGLEGFQYQIEPTGKYRTMLVFHEAMNSAAAQFEKAGALKSIRSPHFADEDVLVQHYPAPRLTVIIFHRKVAGKSHYAKTTFNTDKAGNPLGKEAAGRRN